MGLYVASLNSGSNANCYYIGTENDAVLIDAGLSCRETERRLKKMGLNAERIKAIFISHEHTDHIRGLEGLITKRYLPAYITAPTLKRSGIKLPIGHTKEFSAHEPVVLGELTVTAFPKLHDAADPHSFIISGGGATVGVFTDIGKVCEHVEYYFTKCNAVFLESNYDVQMLMNGRYNQYLKARVHGDHGHLSNEQALELMIRHKPAHMTHIFLSHLSQENNEPELATALFKSHAGATAISVAPRYGPSEIFTISASGDKQPARLQQGALW